jgi:geranylgeranyl diphosphate synthase type I
MTVTSTQSLPAIDIGQVIERVDSALAGFLAEQHRRFDALPIDPVGRTHWRSVLTDLAGMLEGGKRLRPVFCYLGWLGAGGEPGDEGALTAAAALELLHAFALVHDDVMDASALRRGRPTVHTSQAALHARSGWRGSSPAFGDAAGILVGDLCLGWFHGMLESSGLPPDRLRPARALLADAFTELIVGQYLDGLGQAGAAASPEFATNVIHYKTAKYTVERPLQLGMVLAGGGPALVAAVSAYALPLGEAFQLRDDVLGVFGDPAVTGKPADDDLRSGKLTLLMAITRERARPGELADIERLFGAPDLDSGGAEELRAIITRTGALAELEHLIDHRAGVAAAALEGLPVDRAVRSALRGLIQRVTDRVS